MKIILASQSPRRQELFSKYGLEFDVVPSNFDESTIQYLNSPADYCCKLAEEKAKEVSDLYPDNLVIGADTIVVLKNKFFPKPKDLTQTKLFLNELADKTHQVYTGVSLNHKINDMSHSFYKKTDVTFHPLSEDDIDHYTSVENPMDKAGGYGIQDFSSVFVKKIDGCYFNVVGLPLSRLYLEIKKKYSKLIENLLVAKMETL